MACFDVWDIGACGCGPAGCTCGVGNTVTLQSSPSVKCCACTSPGGCCEVTLTFDTPIGGASSYLLDIYSSAYNTCIGEISQWLNQSGITLHVGTEYWQFFGYPSGGLYACSTDSAYTYAFGPTSVASATCGPPPVVVYNVTSANAYILYSAGLRSITMTYTAGYPACCLWNTKILGCNPLSGANLIGNSTVNWWTDSTMTTLISTGTGGNQGVGSAGTWYRQISAPRFTTVAANKAVTCGGTDTTTLTVATGYYCFIGSGCGFPAPSTLLCSFYYAGAQTFTYAAGSWTASFTYLTVAYVISFDTSSNITCTANGVDFSAGSAFAISYCPVVGPFSAAIAVPGSGTGSAIGNGVVTE